MSYILEALAKSEEERRQRAIPDLRTQHTVYPGIKRQKRRSIPGTSRLRPVILFGILLALTAWQFRDLLPVALEIRITRQDTGTESGTGDNLTTSSPGVPQEPSATVMDNATSSPLPAQQATAETGNPEPVAEIAADEFLTEVHIGPSPPQLPARDDQRREPTPGEVRLQPAPLILDDGVPEQLAVATLLPYLDDLPAATRQALPPLKFAGHTYSPVPQQRLIMVNNGIKREGEAIGSGLRLEEITWDGVVLDFRGTRFQVRTTGE